MTKIDVDAVHSEAYKTAYSRKYIFSAGAVLPHTACLLITTLKVAQCLGATVSSKSLESAYNSAQYMIEKEVRGEEYIMRGKGYGKHPEVNAFLDLYIEEVDKALGMSTGAGRAVR